MSQVFKLIEKWYLAYDWELAAATIGVASFSGHIIWSVIRGVPEVIINHKQLILLI